MNEASFIATIRKDGKNGSKIAVKTACNALALQPGDVVDVTIRKRD